MLVDGHGKRLWNEGLPSKPMLAAVPIVGMRQVSDNAPLFAEATEDMHRCRHYIERPSSPHFQKHWILTSEIKLVRPQKVVKYFDMKREKGRSELLFPSPLLETK